MSHPRIIAGLGILVSLAWLTLCIEVTAQVVEGEMAGTFQPSLGSWEQRVLRSNTGRLASYEATQQPMVMEPGDGMIIGASDPGAAEGFYDEGGHIEGAPGCGEGGMCAPCDDVCGGSCCGPCSPRPFCWLRNFSVFAGVQGFKNPLDQGRNGNFGFHEGVNFGTPLGDSGIGYQVGFQAVQSNFMGDQTALIQNRPRYENEGHNQVFLTTGLFRRACNDCGWQGGVVFDYLHDDYYASTTLQQIRAELSVRINGRREIGYWGAYGLGSDHFSDPLRGDFHVAPNDLHTFFYRHHFSGGAQTRLWTGFSGNSEWVFGGDASVPLGTSWALENSFAYVLPKDKGRTGQEDESWSVMMQLVWYPGRCARQAINAPFQPLLGVADNSVFLVDRK